VEKREWLEITRYIANVLGKDMENEQFQGQIKAYFDILRWFPASVMRDAAKKVLAEHEYNSVPPVGVFRKAALEIQARRKPEPRALQEKAEVCPACQNIGMLIFMKNVGGVPCEYAAHCTCEYGERYKYRGKDCRENPTRYYIPSIAEVFTEEEWSL